MFGNRTICARVFLVWAKGTLRYDHRMPAFVVAVEQTELDKIAGTPTAQLLESLKLPSVLIAPASRIGRFRRRLEFDECARRCSLRHESDIRPPDARLSILRHNDHAWGSRKQSKQSFEQLLESRGERRLRNVRIGAAKLPNSVRVGLKEDSDAHCYLLTCVSHDVISMPSSCRTSSGARSSFSTSS